MIKSGILALLALALASSLLIAQTQYSIGSPSNEQLYMLELINRARADGGAEAVRLGLSGLQEGPPSLGGEAWTIQNTVQPLSWNPLLFNAAQAHATNLNNADQFFLGGSPHTFGGTTPDGRIAAAGYSTAPYSGPSTSPSHYLPGPENIAESVSSGSGPFSGAKLISAVLQAHNGLFTDQSVPGRGHRDTTMLAFFREFGVGISTGTDIQSTSGQPDHTWDSLYLVQNFGTQSGSTPFITGVVYQDLNGNNFYDAGEGLGGVRVDVTGSSYYAVTASSGGYSVPVAGNGSYPIKFSGGSVVTSSGTATVTGLLNTKVDYLAEVLAGITAAARSGSDFVVSFQTLAQRSYRLERATSLTLPDWQSIPGLADIFASTAGVKQVTDPGALGQGKAFYRVRLLP